MRLMSGSFFFVLIGRSDGDIIMCNMDRFLGGFGFMGCWCGCSMYCSGLRV